MDDSKAVGEVLTEYVIENANLKITIRQLQLEIEALKKEKEEDK